MPMSYGVLEAPALVEDSVFLTGFHEEFLMDLCFRVLNEWHEKPLKKFLKKGEMCIRII